MVRDWQARLMANSANTGREDWMWSERDDLREFQSASSRLTAPIGSGGQLAIRLHVDNGEF